MGDATMLKTATLPAPQPSTRERDFTAEFEDLPEKMNGFTLFRVSNFNKSDVQITRKAFTKKETDIFPLSKTHLVPIPEGFLSTRELLQNLKNEGKALGNELHLLAFSIARPNYQRYHAVIALGCRWEVEDGVFVPCKQTTQHSEIFCPYIYGTANTRFFGAHPIHAFKDLRCEMIVYDI